MVEQEIDLTVGDDGLTNEERRILQTPVSQVAPEQRHILVALRDKKSAHIYAENDRQRTEDRERRAAQELA